MSRLQEESIRAIGKSAGPAEIHGEVIRGPKIEPDKIADRTIVFLARKTTSRNIARISHFAVVKALNLRRQPSSQFQAIGVSRLRLLFRRHIAHLHPLCDILPKQSIANQRSLCECRFQINIPLGTGIVMTVKAMLLKYWTNLFFKVEGDAVKLIAFLPSVFRSRRINRPGNLLRFHLFFLVSLLDESKILQRFPESLAQRHLGIPETPL